MHVYLKIHKSDDHTPFRNSLIRSEIHIHCLVMTVRERGVSPFSNKNGEIIIRGFYKDAKK